jgi:hypothetical protein
MSAGRLQKGGIHLIQEFEDVAQREKNEAGVKCATERMETGLADKADAWLVSHRGKSAEWQ